MSPIFKRKTFGLALLVMLVAVAGSGAYYLLRPKPRLILDQQTSGKTIRFSWQIAFNTTILNGGDTPIDGVNVTQTLPTGFLFDAGYLTFPNATTVSYEPVIQADTLRWDVMLHLDPGQAARIVCHLNSTLDSNSSRVTTYARGRSYYNGFFGLGAGYRTVTSNSVDETILVEPTSFKSFLKQMYSTNPDFVRWLCRDNPFYYSFTEDGELDDYERELLSDAATLGGLAPHLIRMPEVYTKETNLTEVLNYIDALQLIESRDPEAAQFVLETGLFMEDKTFSNLEKRFVDESLGKPDLFRVYVCNWVLDGIEDQDFERLRSFNAPESGELGYLADDLYNLPEIRDGISPREAEAIRQLEAMVSASETDYQIRKGVYLIDEYGVPDPSLFSFIVPNSNTQLQVLLWLAQDREIHGDYRVLALAFGLDYGSVVTMGDDEVDAAVRNYVPKMLDFIVETDEIIKQYGTDWQATDYPLEADIGLVWGAGGSWPQEGPRAPPHYWPPQPSWLYALNEKLGGSMNKADFDWLFVSINTLKDMRHFMIENGFLELKARERAPHGDSWINGFYDKWVTNKRIDYEKGQEQFPYSFFSRIDHIVADLNDYFFIGEGAFKTERFEPGQEIDGKILYSETICNPDYVWKKFKEEGIIRLGACMTDSCLETTMAGSVNLSTLMGDIKGGIEGHSFIIYYDPEQKSLQTTPFQALYILRGKGELFYGWSKIYWDNFYLQDKIPSQCGFYPYIFTDKTLYAKGVPPAFIYRNHHPEAEA